MAATWAIETTDRNLSDGGVTVARWSVTDSETVGDTTYTAGSYGSCNFTYDTSSEGFTPYADLTQSEVLGWCWSVGEVDKAGIEADLTANINEQKTPTKGSGVPW